MPTVAIISQAIAASPSLFNTSREQVTATLKNDTGEKAVKTFLFWEDKHCPHSGGKQRGTCPICCENQLTAWKESCAGWSKETE